MFSLQACTIYQQGSHTDVGRLTLLRELAIEPGQTPAYTLSDNLGPPDWIVTSGKSDIWTYDIPVRSGSGFSLIPLISVKWSNAETTLHHFEVAGGVVTGYWHTPSP